MFIVWGEKRSRELKVTLGSKGATAVAQDQRWPLFGEVLLQLLGGGGCSAPPTKSTDESVRRNSPQFGKYKVGSITEGMFALCHALVVHLPRA